MTVKFILVVALVMLLTLDVQSCLMGPKPPKDWVKYGLMNQTYWDLLRARQSTQTKCRSNGIPSTNSTDNGLCYIRTRRDEVKIGYCTLVRRFRVCSWKIPTHDETGRNIIQFNNRDCSGVDYNERILPHENRTFTKKQVERYKLKRARITPARVSRIPRRCSMVVAVVSEIEGVCTWLHRYGAHNRSDVYGCHSKNTSTEFPYHTDCKHMMQRSGTT